MKTGAKVIGWWAWWPTYGGAYLRRFETEEDAIEYVPTKQAPPLGNKWVMRVGYGPASNEEENYYGFNHDEPRIYSEAEVREQWFKNLETKAAEKEAKNEA
jgi:hypothetical protein